ncbi:MAG: Crp/Fnr family transcriptional regulator [Sphingomicrobium sp.]
MSMTADQSLAPMVRKLELWNGLSQADRDGILGLPFTLRSLHAGHVLVWDGDEPKHASVLISGFAYRHKSSGRGRRQIMSIHMKGDVLDLQNSLLGLADHNIQMLSAGVVAVIPVEALRTLAFERPAVGMAMWSETLVEGSIFREWLLNIGRRDARTRLAHLLCEFAMRLESAGLGTQGGYLLPMTQEQIGDAVALTPVHVNRSLMRLEEEGLIARTKRNITIRDWHAMSTTADFDARYLHLKSGPLLEG